MIILIAALIYKAYLDIKIEDPDKKVSILSIIAFQRYSMFTLMPLSTQANNEAEKKLRRKANRVLLVFYTSFAIILLLAIFG